MVRSVQIQSEELIKPSSPTPSTVLSLSLLDSQHFLRYTIEFLFIYSPQTLLLDRQAFVNRFKSALSKALVPYYPLAGRLQTKSEGLGLEVVCESQGIPFIEAVSSYVISDFRSTPQHKSDWRDLLSFHIPNEFDSGPCLAFQLTWLQDGNAAAISVGYKHAMIDGIGVGRFLAYLGKLVKQGVNIELDLKPTWDRKLLDSITSFKVMETPSEFNQVVDICGIGSRFFEERLVPTSIVFDRTTVEKLRNVALETSSTGTTFSSFDVLSAHVWKSWATSLNLPPNQTLKLLFSVNIRNKLDTTVPPGYYGNAFVISCAQSTAKDLAEKGLGHTAEVVKRAKERVDVSYTKMVIDLLKEGKKGADSVGALILTQCTRLGFEDFDFGMGKPVKIYPLCPDRFCLIMPERDDAGEFNNLHVVVAVPESALGDYVYVMKNPFSMRAEAANLVL